MRWIRGCHWSGASWRRDRLDRSQSAPHPTNGRSDTSAPHAQNGEAGNGTRSELREPSGRIDGLWSSCKDAGAREGLAHPEFYSVAPWTQQEHEAAVLLVAPPETDSNSLSSRAVISMSSMSTR